MFAPVGIAIAIITGTMGLIGIGPALGIGPGIAIGERLLKRNQNKTN